MIRVRDIPHAGKKWDSAHDDKYRCVCVWEVLSNCYYKAAHLEKKCIVIGADFVKRRVDPIHTQ